MKVFVRNVTSVIKSLMETPRDVFDVPKWIYTRYAYPNPLSMHQAMLPYSVLRFIKQRQPPIQTVFEYGSGGSTLWFANRVKSLISIEHDPNWYLLVKKELERCNKTNVKINLKKPNNKRSKYSSAVVSGNFEQYVKSIDRVANKSLDFVLVDGRCRVPCIVRCLPKIREGGYVMLDDSDRLRYQSIPKRLNSWIRRDFWGIRVFNFEPAHSTVWENTKKDLNY